MKKYIVVAGNIGVGKSSLVRRLADRLGWEPHFEPAADNPYLADFYQDMGRWSFHSQVFFLARQLKHQLSLVNREASVVQDRCIYEDAEIFAEHLFRQGSISARDHRTYRELYEALITFLAPPDLVIYLRASLDTLLKRIALRGRDYEREISPDYLARLNDLYRHWIDNFTLCPALTVPADELDYVTHDAHLDLIVTKVQEKLQGKEEVVFDGEEMRGPDR